MSKRFGRQTVKIEDVRIASEASIVGEKEGEGPLGGYFDIVLSDSEWNEKTWEKTESKMQREAIRLATTKAQKKIDEIDRVFSGDLLNQCIGAGFGLRELGIPFYGLYGACSTMIEGISIASMLTEGGFVKTAAAAASSHFCTAERQYRTPLEYGGQRTPNSQWTVTGAASVITEKGAVKGDIAVSSLTAGKIVDMGIKDTNNMGGAMAPAAYDTIKAHLSESKTDPAEYDAIVTGDLGTVGSEILVDLLLKDGIDISKSYKDCGCIIFSKEEQDVHAGGSGCGCIASVLCGYFFNKMRRGELKKILAVGTGALLSPTSSLQGESVPGIAHAVAFEIK